MKLTSKIFNHFFKLDEGTVRSNSCKRQTMKPYDKIYLLLVMHKYFTC
jgi:hypothetical protein